MKKIGIFILLMLLFIINVNASNNTIVSHQVIVTNKDGTICYEDGKKTDKVIPYGTTLTVETDINGSYIYVFNDTYQCDVKYNEVSSKTQSFDINNKEVQDIKSTRAIVLIKSGVNLRKGPSVTYSKIITVPQYTIVNLTKKAGTYWYYLEYKDYSGWITTMDKYVGFDNNHVLVNYDKTNIYDSSGKKIVGTIPANMEITDYVDINHDKLGYYVVYNGVSGYLYKNSMMYKIDTPGKIKLTNDYVIYDDKNIPIKKLQSGLELEYTMINNDSDSLVIYVPEKKLTMTITDGIEYIKEAKVSVKTNGYIGDGIFGEERIEREVIETPTPTPEDNTKNNKDVKEIIIICLLALILIAIIIWIIILKKNKPVIINKSE